MFGYAMTTPYSRNGPPTDSDDVAHRATYDRYPGLEVAEARSRLSPSNQQARWFDDRAPLCAHPGPGQAGPQRCWWMQPR